ncbi:hypothetical protein DW228_20935 [Bacteroides fragilis]|uniref:Transmembrane protein n=1 Tax=Bacteroides fragilis TaxID=817 RepID=A0A396BSM3_BACFG|nr:hypothetical protein EC81_007545 [Bacteroides fragilis]QRM71858.1 hypothetical protein F7887_18770 [Bacteroides fragilis]RHH06603.1 hypothetical protein DW228_20935 [Bacteroides fragilis]RHH67715.1 hypothetical protein DW198_11975 [Bacteroides fragilis]
MNCFFRVLCSCLSGHMFSERRVCDLHVTFELIGKWGVEIVPVTLLFILMFFSLLETQEVSFVFRLMSFF